MERRDEEFMSLALEEARRAFDEGEVPVGAVVVKEGKVIATGHNSRENENDISGHAEINAIKAAEKVLGRWTLEGCALYVTLEPCPMCAGAIKQCRLSSLVFGAKDEAEGAVMSRYHLFDADNGAQSITFGVLEKECSDLLKTFFAKKRKEAKS